MRFPKWPRWVWRCYAATFTAVATFVACSFVPMWEIRLVDPIFEPTTSHTLWVMIGLPDSDPYDRIDGRYVVYSWEMPAFITAVAVHIAAIVGAILGGVRWRKGDKPHPPSPSPFMERGCSTCESSGANAEQTERNRS